MNTYTVKRGTIIFCGSPDCPEVLEYAKEYIRCNQMTNEDVGIFRYKDTIMVVAKQLVEIII